MFFFKTQIITIIKKQLNKRVLFVQDAKRKKDISQHEFTTAMQHLLYTINKFTSERYNVLSDKIYFHEFKK
jgi:hypothetical protein